MELFSLISSLPALKLFEEPFLSREKFLSYCSAGLQGKELELLEKFSIVPEEGNAELLLSFPEKSLPRAYMRWEKALRNSIAKIRAGKWKNGEAGPNVRPEAGYEADAERAVLQAYAASNPLERERLLDQARWDKLDELSAELFSYDTLCAYSLKLQLIQKWMQYREADASANMDRMAEEVQKTK